MSPVKNETTTKSKQTKALTITYGNTFSNTYYLCIQKTTQLVFRLCHGRKVFFMVQSFQFVGYNNNNDNQNNNLFRDKLVLHVSAVPTLAVSFGRSMQLF